MLHVQACSAQGATSCACMQCSGCHLMCRHAVLRVPPHVHACSAQGATSCAGMQCSGCHLMCRHAVLRVAPHDQAKAHSLLCMYLPAISRVPMHLHAGGLLMRPSINQSIHLPWRVASVQSLAHASFYRHYNCGTGSGCIKTQYMTR